MHVRDDEYSAKPQTRARPPAKKSLDLVAPDQASGPPINDGRSPARQAARPIDAMRALRASYDANRADARWQALRRFPQGHGERASALFLFVETAQSAAISGLSADNPLAIKSALTK
jgi:hypothetical protein